MTIGIISHESGELHETGPGHPEKPQRLITIHRAIKAYDFLNPIKFYEAPAATKEQLALAHDKRYIEWIFSISPKHETIAIDEDTVMGPQTLTAALHAAGAVIKAVDLVMAKDIEAAFCNVRPPGHHAEFEKAMGFCFFNNIAVGVRHAMSEYDIQRVLIVDFDVHHGNGTQSIFQKDKKVMLCSSFEHPLYPGYDAEMDNKHILSLPLPAGTTGEAYRREVRESWLTRIHEFKPEMIFFSAGFDAHSEDPMANIQFNKEDYVWITKEMVNIAKQYAQGRVISALEGGYNLEVLAECVPAHIEALV